MKQSIVIGFAVALFLLVGSACAEALTIACYAGNVSGTVIRTVAVNGDHYLFLPSCARTAPLVIYADTDCELAMANPAGQTLPLVSGELFYISELMAAEPENEEYSLIVQCGNGEADSVTVILSANIPSLFLQSEDPVHQGRIWLEDCENHERTTTGKAVMLRADGSMIYNGKLQEIRGRGTSTWSIIMPDGSNREGDQKRPYQITLNSKVDLLDTGNPREANKRWVLLADFFDSTLLRNRIALDLALELGLKETSHCQPVDLYYDGEYRGRYLLAEKVEVGDGRVEVVDYDKILKKWNILDKTVPGALNQIVSTNKYGNTFYATEDVWDAEETSLGGYLIELDNAFGTQEQAYFTLQNVLTFTIRNPEYASAGMVKYISELFEDIYSTVMSGGISPKTGASWNDYFDMDFLLPFFWVNEWSKNDDAWSFSSTYFTLPAQSQKIEMGPVWDFDLAFYTRSYSDGRITNPTGLIETAMRESLGYGLLQIPAFQELAAQYFLDVLDPIITRILLGDIDARSETLHSLAWYWEQEAASRRMNSILWNPSSVLERFAAPNYDVNFENLCAYIQERTAWLKKEVTRWQDPVMLDTAKLILTASYANAEGTLKVVPEEPNGSLFILDQTYTLEREATESTFALWRADITIFTEIGYNLTDNAALIINNTMIPYKKEEDGSVTASVWFEDLSYRTAEYHGVDYGLVFDADYYAAHYPDIIAKVGNDHRALLQWYVENGIADGQAANVFFNPREILDALPNAEEMLGDYYEDIVLFFIEAGYVDWMSLMGKTYEPKVRTAIGGF
ncbi:MAG: CotH kinase family protein [Bacillota bacterium]